MITRVKKNKVLNFVVMAYCIVGIQNLSFGATEQFDYPELSVVPRASDRIHSESEKESARKWTAFLPYQVSGLVTLAAGAASMNPNDPTSTLPGTIGVAVGASWFTFATLMALTYTPYDSAWKEVGALPKGNTREQLTRERAAEEEISRIASTASRIKWLSVITQFGASAYMIAAAPKSYNGVQNYLAQGLQYGSAILALTPLLFSNHWGNVYDEQKEYKKRIYAPVAQGTFFVEPTTRQLIPGMMFSMQF